MVALVFPDNPSVDDEHTDANSIVWICTHAIQSSDAFTAWAVKPVIETHNNLLGIQGGLADERYHVSLDESYAIDGAAGPTITNVFATMQDVADMLPAPATAISADTTLFNGNLGPNDDTVQKALDTMDEIVVSGSPPASAVPADVTNFDGKLGGFDDTVQKALDTLDDANDIQDAEEVATDTTNFSGNLSPADDTVQKALDTLDEIVGVGVPSAGQVSVDTSTFNKHLSSGDNTVQLALNTLDDVPDANSTTVSVITDTFNNNLSSDDDTVQKAMETLDNVEGLSIPDHNALAGLQGGAADYYHLDVDKYYAGENANSASNVNPFATIQDINDIDEGQGTKRNYLINGGMTIWQRSENEYGYNGEYVAADRWMIYTEGGSVRHTKHVDNTTEYLRCTQESGGAANIGISQRIEYGAELANQQITLAFDWVPILATTGKVSVRFFGGGQDIVDIPNPTVAGRKVLYIQNPPVALDPDAYLELSIYANDSFDITNIMLVEGWNVNTEYQSESPEETVLSCARYYFKQTEEISTTVSTGSLGEPTEWQYPGFPHLTQMRVAPYSSVDSFTCESNPDATVIGSSAGAYSILYIQCSEMLTAGVYKLKYTVDAEI